MPKLSAARSAKPIAAQCALDKRRFAIDISDITPEGCSARAPAGWDAQDDFLELTIAGRIDIKGRLEWSKGHLAGIRFFGQLHPLVVDQLAGAH